MDSSKKSKSKSKPDGVRRSINYPNQPPQQQQFSPHQQQQFPPHQLQQFPTPHQQQFSQQFPQQYPPQYSYPQYYPPPPPQQSFSQQPFSPQHYSQHNTNSPQYTQNFSQEYSQSPTEPILEPTPEFPHSPQSPVDESGGMGPPKKKTDKVSFTKQEDIFLATAFVRTSDNPVTGRDQTLNAYWSGITSAFNEMAREAGLSYRSTKSLKNRFSRMKSDVTIYNEAVSHIGSKYFSGINEMDKLDKIRERFQQRNTKYKGVPFKFDHVLNIMGQCSKFNFITTRGNLPKDRDANYGSDEEPPQTPAMGSNEGSTEQSQQYHSGEKRPRDAFEGNPQEAISPSHPSRPMGSKAAKQAARKGKGKITDNISEMNAVTVHRTSMYEQELAYKEKAQAARMQVMHDSLEIEREKLAMDKEKLEMDRDFRIMQMDPNLLPTDADREQLTALRNSIWAKWRT